MSALDEAKAYTIHIQQILMRGLTGVIKDEKTYDFNFRPVELVRFDYYSISDIHGERDLCYSRGSYLKDKLDVLFILGDVSSF